MALGRVPTGIINLPEKCYEEAIQAALKKQDKVFGTHALQDYLGAPDAYKKQMQEIWMTGFTALLRKWL